MKAVVIALLLTGSALASVPVQAQEQVQGRMGADSLTLSGAVYSVEGEPLAGAQVLVVGTTEGTVTDARGTFSLKNVPEGRQVVAVSLDGYGKQWHELDAASFTSERYVFALRKIPTAARAIPLGKPQVEQERCHGTSANKRLAPARPAAAPENPALCGGVQVQALEAQWERCSRGFGRRFASFETLSDMLTRLLNNGRSIDGDQCVRSVAG